MCPLGEMKGLAFSANPETIKKTGISSSSQSVWLCSVLLLANLWYRFQFSHCVVIGSTSNHVNCLLFIYFIFFRGSSCTVHGLLFKLIPLSGVPISFNGNIFKVNIAFL